MILHEENIPVIFITGHVEEALLQRASRVSTDGYIVKPVHARQLQGAIEVAIRKNNHHSDDSNAENEALVKPENVPPTDENRQIKRLLSPAEYRVTKLLKSGKSSQEIAGKLSLSARTVEWHRMNIRKKLGIFNKKISIFNYLQLL